MLVRQTMSGPVRATGRVLNVLQDADCRMEARKKSFVEVSFCAT